MNILYSFNLVVFFFITKESYTDYTEAYSEPCQTFKIEIFRENS